MGSPIYDEMVMTENSHWWFKARKEIFISLLRRFGGSLSEMRILDVGCGCGAMALAFSALSGEVVGIESSIDAIKFCQERGVKVIKGDLSEPLPLQKESYDSVFFLDVLEHIEDDAGALASGVEMLKPGGLVLATVPAHKFLWTRRDEFHEHKRRYSKREFEKLFEKLPLEKIILSYYNTFLFFPIMVSRVGSRILGIDKMEPDVRIPMPPINYVLEKIFAFERHLLGRIQFPTGISLLALYRKK